MRVKDSEQLIVDFENLKKIIFSTFLYLWQSNQTQFTLLSFTIALISRW